MQLLAMAMAKWVLPVPVPPTSLGDEAAAGEVVHEGLVDRRALELEVVEVLGERQLWRW
jgi:hypothetical protein